MICDFSKIMRKKLYVTLCFFVELSQKIGTSRENSYFLFITQIDTEMTQSDTEKKLFYQKINL